MGVRILFIHPERILREVVREFLFQQFGDKAHCAHDTVSGLVAAKKRRPDLVFIYWGGPGLDAFDCYGRVMYLRQSRRLGGCWPLKGAYSQPRKTKPLDDFSFVPSFQRSRNTGFRIAIHLPERTIRLKAHSRNCRTLCVPRQSRGVTQCT